MRKRRVAVTITGNLTMSGPGPGTRRAGSGRGARKPMKQGRGPCISI